MQCAVAHLEALEPRLLLAASPVPVASAALLNLPAQGALTVTGATGDGVNDAYEFDVIGTGLLNLALTGTGSPTFRVYNVATGRQIAASAKPRKAGLPSSLVLRVAAGQHLRVVTTDGQMPAGEYTLQLVARPTDDVSGDQARARRIVIGKTGLAAFAGSINFLTDTDALSLVATRDGSIAVEVKAKLAKGNMVTRVFAYDADGELLAEGDPSSAGGTATVSFDVAKGELYYLVVSGEQGTGLYTLKAANSDAVLPDPTPEPAPSPGPAPQPPALLPTSITPTPGAAVQATVVTLVSGQQLLIAGTNGDDTIVIGYANGKYTVQSAGGTQEFGQAIGGIAIYGFDGNDTIRVTADVVLPAEVFAGAGNDTVLVAGAGGGAIWGGEGDDLIVSVGGGAHVLNGEGGTDSFWVDRTDIIADAAANEAHNTHRVTGFANLVVSAGGMVGDSGQVKLTDPAITGAAVGYADFGSHPLFVNGVSKGDVVGGGATDATFLLTMVALVDQNAAAVAQMIAPMGDGTYIVDFSVGNRTILVRVDSDLPVRSDGTLAYAQAGPDGEIWLPLMEKAYTTLRTGETYDPAVPVKNNMLAAYQAVRQLWLTKETSQRTSGYLDRAFRKTSDANDLVFGLAWIMQSYVSMFEATGDLRLLEQVKSDIDYMFSVRDDALGRVDELRGYVVKSWSTTKDTGGMLPQDVGKRHTLVLFAGNILQPIARWIYLVKRDPLLYARYRTDVDVYTQKVEETIAEFDQDWREAVVPGENLHAGNYGFTVLPGEGYYYGPESHDPVNYNRQNAMGRTLITMYEVTGRQDYLDKAAKLAKFFQRAAMILLPDGGYTWYASFWNRGSATMEDIGHAATSMMFMVDAYRAGIVFTRTDIERLGVTFERFTKRDAAGNVTGWWWLVDGTGVTDTTSQAGGAGLWNYLGMELDSVAQTLLSASQTLSWLHDAAWCTLGLTVRGAEEVLA